MIAFENLGYCPICEDDAQFRTNNEWLRDHYFCRRCKSIPRERALMEVIRTNCPEWRNLVIHESSPAPRGVSKKLENECSSYISSHFRQDADPGKIVDGFRNEDFENLTFEDNSIDLHVSQDVMEHILDPEKAFAEIARTLKPGGKHIFTVPLVNKWNPSKRRAVRNKSGDIVHIEKPSYHGNPIGDGKSLVTVDWGFDICEHIFAYSGMFSKLIYIDNLDMGIRAEYNEVLISYKSIRQLI